MYRRPILCTLYGTVDFLNVLKKYIISRYHSLTRQISFAKNGSSQRSIVSAYGPMQFVEIPRRSIIICFSSLLAKAGFKSTLFEISCYDRRLRHRRKQDSRYAANVPKYISCLVLLFFLRSLGVFEATVYCATRNAIAKKIVFIVYVCKS
jgi:hypothetical protein